MSNSISCVSGHTDTPLWITQLSANMKLALPSGLAAMETGADITRCVHSEHQLTFADLTHRERLASPRQGGMLNHELWTPAHWCCFRTGLLTGHPSQRREEPPDNSPPPQERKQQQNLHLQPQWWTRLSYANISLGFLSAPGMLLSIKLSFGTFSDRASVHFNLWNIPQTGQNSIKPRKIKRREVKQTPKLLSCENTAGT